MRTRERVNMTNKEEREEFEGAKMYGSNLRKNAESSRKCDLPRVPAIKLHEIR